MVKNPESPLELLDALETETNISRQRKEDLEKLIPWSLKYEEATLPIQILLIAGAWVSAIMFLAFLAALGLFNSSNSTVLIFLGLVLTIGAIGLDRVGGLKKEFQPSQLFLQQFSVVCILAGKICILIGILSILKWRAVSDPSFPLFTLLIALLTYPFFKVPLERFLSMGAALSVVAVWVQNELPIALPFYTIILLVLSGLVYTQEKLYREGRPFLFSSILTICWICGFNQVQLSAKSNLIQFPYYALILVFLLAFAVVWIPALREEDAPGNRALSFFGGAYFLLSFIGVPGILFALLLIFYGTRQADNLLLLPGLFLLPYSLGAYYYLLQVDLATKSYLLMGSGVLLLVLRKVLKNSGDESVSS